MRFRRHGADLVVDAPAKLNLFLEVRGKRPDGYHELETLMVAIGLCDTLRFSPQAAPGVELRAHFACDSDAQGFPLGEDNLIVRAAQLLARTAGIERGVAIDVLKRIPPASGLGGGSSDAAATLVALNRLWGAGLGFDELDQLAAQLGSDLNFFIRSPLMALCGGRGEIVEPRRLQRTLHFVVLRPPGGLSTAAVFREWRRDVHEPRSAATLLDQLNNGGGTAINSLFNALTAPAARLSDEIAAGLRALRDAGGDSALMTGSGSACFCLCESARQARRVGSRLRQRAAGRVWVVNTGI
ncbi:MAG: 4-(cytidine 5'-diphospho)-2-C-methyl-D-erythritol kinase [Planctomycetaceae bacterium]